MVGDAISKPLGNFEPFMDLLARAPFCVWERAMKLPSHPQAPVILLLEKIDPKTESEFSYDLPGCGPGSDLRFSVVHFSLPVGDQGRCVVPGILPITERQSGVNRVSGRNFDAVQ